MSYLFGQILICLLIAGLIGAVIGWLLRGGCSKKIQDCEEEWKMKLGSLESEWNSKLQRSKQEEKEEDVHAAYEHELDNREIQAATLKRHAEHVESEKPTYSYEQELKEKLQIAQENIQNDVQEQVQAVEEKLDITPETAAAGIVGSDDFLKKDAAVADNSAYEKELEEKLKAAKEEVSFNIPKSDAPDIGEIRALLASKHISLSDEKIALYTENGIDLENGVDLEDNYTLETIEGIGPKYAQRLGELGITSTQDLLTKLAKNHDGINQAAKALQVQPEAISSWVSMADLIQLPGVNAQAAELMQTVGISSTTELGITNPNSLFSEMVAFNKKSPIAPEVPSAESLSLWSKVAKALG